jgi:hypothetical protein
MTVSRHPDFIVIPTAGTIGGGKLSNHLVKAVINSTPVYTGMGAAFKRAASKGFDAQGYKIP